MSEQRTHAANETARSLVGPVAGAGMCRFYDESRAFAENYRMLPLTTS